MKTIEYCGKELTVEDWCTHILHIRSGALIAIGQNGFSREIYSCRVSPVYTNEPLPKLTPIVEKTKTKTVTAFGQVFDNAPANATEISLQWPVTATEISLRWPVVPPSEDDRRNIALNMAYVVATTPQGTEHIGRLDTKVKINEA
jgi:hypothetical protein